MSWKLTIDVIFNSFPLIKKQKSDPFSLSLRAKRGNPTTPNPSLRAKRGNPTTPNLSLRAKRANPTTSNPSLRAKQ